MAEEEIAYDQVETGDPDPLGLRRQLKLAKGPKDTPPSSDPLRLRAKLTVSKIKPQQAEPSPAFKPASDWFAIPQGYQPMATENAVPIDDHTKKVNQASQRVQSHLLDIDPSVRNLIYDHKKELLGRAKSQQLSLSPKEAGPINQQAQLLESQTREDVPVVPEEIEEFKAGMNENQVMLRQGLAQKVKDLTKADPAQANVLKGDIYRLDRQGEPDKEKVVSKNIDKINEGKYDYDVVNGRLIKPEGFWKSIVTGFQQKNQLFKDYELYTKTDNEAAIIRELNEKMKSDPDQAIPVPDGFVAEQGAALGGQPIKPIVGAFAAGAATSGLGAAAAGAGIAAHEMYKLGYASALPQNYAALKREHPEVPDYEIYQQAKRLSEDQANTDAASGAAMGAIGARVALKPSTSLLLQKTVKSALKQIGETVAIEGFGGGAVGAAGQYIKNVMAQRAGIPVDTSEGMAQQLVGGAFMTLGMALAGKAGTLLKPSTYNKLLHGLSKLPEETISSELTKAQEVGALTPEEAQRVQVDISDQKKVDASIRGDVPEPERIKIQEKIKERNQLESELETADKAFHPEIKEKIKSIEEEIVNTSKGKDRGELQQLIDKSKIEGAVKEYFKDLDEKELKAAFKEISEQAHDPNSANQALEVFGEEIVNKAKELYPQEAPKESKITVIQPGEMKQPETITIKPKTNEPATAIVAEEPAMGEVGNGGIPEGDAATPSIEGGMPAQENTSAGQDGAGLPPLPPSEGKGVYVERPDTQLSFRGLQETANEFGFEDVKPRDRVSDIQERKNAEMEVNEWASKGEYQKNIDDLLGRIERKEMAPVARQRLILEQYLANEKQKARDLYGTPEHDAQLNKVERIKKIGEIARQETAASLRLPNEGSGVHPINDEVDAMIAKMEANSVDKLTDQQKAEVKAQVEKYKKAADEANAKAAAFEEQASKVDAEKEFKKVKSTTKRTKKTAEERVAFRKSEVEAARMALKKLRTGESGLSAVPLPYLRELIAIAPHVKNIMVDLVAEGIDNLHDVVKHLHDEFKDVLDVITEKDIHDIIAGEYNEKSRPLSELQRQVKDIQDEAKLINQYESLVNGKEPKTEKAKRERNQKIKDLKDKIKSFRQDERDANKLSKEELDDDAKKLIAIKKRNQKREQEIKEKIANGQFEKETKKSIFDREDLKKTHPGLRKDALDAIVKKEDAQHEFDLALFNDEMKRRKFAQKWIRDFGGKLVHTSKAIMSGIDDSATFVQNGMVMLSNPDMGIKAWREHWKDAFNDARFRRELAALHADPDFEVMQKSKLEIVEPHTAASKQVEEAFEKNLLAGKFKIGDKEFQPWKYTGGIFERAFTSMGNNLRVKLFKERMQMLKEEGKTFESHSQEYKDAARSINELTGRGKLPSGIAQASPYLTPVMWAPRLLTSTINTLGLSDIAFTMIGKGNKGYYRSLTPMQRRFALRQLEGGVSMGVAIMGAAALGGAKVDYDPRSVTFGDIIAGDHHYNVFGRYTPVIKTIVQFVMGERVKKDGVQDLDSGVRGAKTRVGVVEGFFRGKMTPAAGAAYDLAEGKNYFTNKPFGVSDLPEALLTPMSVKELREGWKNDGTWTILNRFLPAFEGLKVSDERDFNKKEESTQSSASGRGRSKTKRTNPHKR